MMTLLCGTLILPFVKLCRRIRGDQKGHTRRKRDLGAFGARHKARDPGDHPGQYGMPERAIGENEDAWGQKTVPSEIVCTIHGRLRCSAAEKRCAMMTKSLALKTPLWNQPMICKSETQRI